MKFFITYKYLLAGILLGASIVYLLAKVTTDKKLGELQISLETSITASVASTTELASAIGTGRMPSVEAIVVDCSTEERTRFEATLARLDTGLSLSELEEVDKLFSRCAPVQSIRRTLMVMDFARQYEALATLITQRKQIGEYVSYDSYVLDLGELVKREQRITQLSLDLVFLQREIIDVLMAGEVVTSEAATILKERGYTLRTDLTAEAEAAKAIRDRVLAT